MNLSRRQALALGGATVTVSLLPLGPAFAGAEETQAAIMAFTGGAEPVEGAVELTTPEIAENGNTVPVKVGAEGAVAVAIFAEGNPTPDVISFEFSEMAEPYASTRIRLAGTQNVIAVAKMADGSFIKTARAVKVTIGGCGG